jgi:hypothetical protein
MLRRLWNGAAEKAARAPGDTYNGFLVGWADTILIGPTSRGTKAAIYQLLAGRPGLAITRSVTDPLGRTGVAVTDGGAYLLLIDPQTAQLLAFTTYPMHANSVIPVIRDGVTVFAETGWTNQIGIPPKS